MLAKMRDADARIQTAVFGESRLAIRAASHYRPIIYWRYRCRLGLDFRPAPHGGARSSAPSNTKTATVAISSREVSTRAFWQGGEIDGLAVTICSAMELIVLVAVSGCNATCIAFVALSDTV
ncbi:hypothetical protein F442_04177 [Phytophthora nicotianae P10297]|uniref:Uncharacterized protein n=3 Tax=Phytophthora nicotianae TaxID=4792 RepID=W2ZWC4_PHYNI|nr:hypothetical protein L916_04019 [Phytophthora nicotianae]ETL99191.1 hypothetical protein L917_03926 [Phytophthora nicotianae]ETO81428.1 hypothetical protein F444_04260 [Phytophthora nicotianae P1976]ETP50554.1 hypothetical protein F442_04177 [Phytophthora nicotianae P10297]